LTAKSIFFSKTFHNSAKNTAGELESLLPDVWTRSHPEKVREFRAEEQRRVAERKRHRRAGTATLGGKSRVFRQADGCRSVVRLESLTYGDLPTDPSMFV